MWIYIYVFLSSIFACLRNDIVSIKALHCQLMTCQHLVTNNLKKFDSFNDLVTEKLH